MLKSTAYQQVHTLRLTSQYLNAVFAKPAHVAAVDAETCKHMNSLQVRRLDRVLAQAQAPMFRDLMSARGDLGARLIWCVTWYDADRALGEV